MELAETGRIQIIDSMQINDFTMQGLLFSEKTDYINSYITASFIRRFRMMYFDSTNKKIQLYVSPADSARNYRRDLQNFCRTLLPLLTEFENEVPTELIYSLWSN